MTSSIVWLPVVQSSVSTANHPCREMNSDSSCTTLSTSIDDWVIGCRRRRTLLPEQCRYGTVFDREVVFHPDNSLAAKANASNTPCRSVYRPRSRINPASVMTAFGSGSGVGVGVGVSVAVSVSVAVEFVSPSPLPSPEYTRPAA